MSYQLLISLPIAVSNPCRIILSLRFISSTLIFFKITVSYFTKKKGAISSFYLLLTLEIAFVLFCILTFTFPTSTFYFPYLNLLFSVSEGKKIYHLLLSFIPFSSESVSILIKPSYKSFPNQSSRKKTFHISVQVRKFKEKALHSLYYRTDARVLSLTFKAIYYLVPS